MGLYDQWETEKYHNQNITWLTDTRAEILMVLGSLRGSAEAKRRIKAYIDRQAEKIRRLEANVPVPRNKRASPKKDTGTRPKAKKSKGRELEAHSGIQP